ncbi:hypothetical protein [Bacteroides zhangwenhongii]|uniref:hypothetical protein n=1 Tax=Bacteroides zhangwenhongii TaxID=2650157 RepID=UPI0032BF37F7
MKKKGYFSMLSLFFLLATCGCTRIKSKYDEVKERIEEEFDALFQTDFYSDLGGWDYSRVPLIAPYELCSTLKYDNISVWVCIKRNNLNEFGGPGLDTDRLSVEYAGISDSIIYLSYSEAFDDVIIGGERSDAWKSHRFAIIDVPTDSVEWHETEAEWLDALHKRNIANPQCHHVDSMYEDFANNNRLLFNPPK